MPSPYHGIRPPYTLPSDVVFFHDWRYVDTGSFSWQDENGHGLGIFTDCPAPPMHLVHHHIPHGVRIAAQPATVGDPVISSGADRIYLFPGSMIHDGGVYRLWLESWPREHIASGKCGAYNDLRYFESDDGVEWRAPEIGRIERDGNRRNNIVYGGDARPDSVGFHGGCVFLDPSAPPTERYKAWHLGNATQEMKAAYLARRPNDADKNHLGVKNPAGLFAATSPDGLDWSPIPEPMVLQHSDTQNVCTYDTVTRKYVAYCRSWFFGRRTIGRMESDEFRDFPLPEELFWPDASMDPSELWYNNAKTIMPGTVDYHLMFPMRWSLSTDRFDFHMASSPDGIVWNKVPDGPVCEPGDPGSWNEGVVVPGVGLVELPGHRTGLLIQGARIPHKYPRNPPVGELAWAWWPKERLVALEAEREGAFSLWPLRVTGRAVELNASTHFTGFVQVEACDQGGKPLPGRSFEDCDPVHGDELARTVTWRGQSDLCLTEGSVVILRFRMRAAKLFSARFVS